MKKRIYLHSAICIIALFVLFACGSGKYDHAKNVMKKQAEIGTAYVEALEKAESADDVANALNTYTDEMEKLIPDMKKMIKDLPEMLTQKEPPKELKEEAAKISETGDRIEAASAKLIQYITDPKVQKALDRMASTMGKLNQEG